jgi:hypothetical protein
MSTTSNLHLPYILAAQAQKHVTHNEALRNLDALVQLAVADRDLAAPPSSPAEGDRYIVAASATGAWAGQTGRVAAWQDGAWQFYVPRIGWLAWVHDESAVYIYAGSAWTLFAGGGSSVNPTPLVGVNATADTTNRLSISSPASLFNHQGAGHQVKVNKNAAGDTASFLFQTGFSGRSEIGMTGDDKLHFKVSPDGSTWNEAITIASDGRVGFGTTDPAGVGGDVVLFGNVNSAKIAKVYNASAGGSASARFDLATGVANAYAIFGINNSGGAPAFLMAGGSGINGMYLDWGQHQLRSSNGVARLVVDASGHTKPGIDNTYSCGTSAARWSAVYAANGTIQTSDARDKIVTGRLEGVAGRLIDAVEPVLFRWVDGGNEIVADGVEATNETHPQTGEAILRQKHRVESRPGHRMHAGFMAQDVKAALDSAGLDFAAWGLDDRNDPDSRQWLRPDQLVPLLWQAIRELRAEVAALNSRAR